MTAAPGPTRFAELAAVSARLATTSSRRDKSAIVAELLRRLRPDEVGVAVGLLVGHPRQGRVGVGWSTLANVGAAPADAATLTITDVDRWFDELAELTGSGSAGARRQAVAALFGRATDAEQRLLWGIVSGELRHGALGGVVTDAIAAGAGVPVAAVRRAAMLAGDLAEAARAAFAGGDALAAVDLVPGRAVEPMLASPAADIAEALDATASAPGPDAPPASLVEWKLDGARVQAHRHGGDVRLFTRNLNDVTDRLPDVVELVAALPGSDLVLDGEVAGLDDAEARPRAFQDTMGDFGAGAASERGRGLGAFFFDVLYADGVSLIDEPLALRRAELDARVPRAARLASIITRDAEEAAVFLADAIAGGLEGVMVKSLASPYAAGRRGGAWRKVKPVHTFDLVVLAAEWGHGRRTGWLSNLHLGARGDGDFVMVGKTFKGLTDELLAWQTDALGKLARGDVGSDSSGRGVVHVRPELVVEVAVDGVQRSTRYPGGVALRFARVRRYRDDKTAADADRIEALQALLSLSPGAAHASPSEG